MCVTTTPIATMKNRYPMLFRIALVLIFKVRIAAAAQMYNAMSHLFLLKNNCAPTHWGFRLSTFNHIAAPISIGPIKYRRCVGILYNNNPIIEMKIIFHSVRKWFSEYNGAHRITMNRNTIMLRRPKYVSCLRVRIAYESGY